MTASPQHHPQDVSIVHPVLAGILAGFVGFASTFPVVLAGYIAMGATADEAASALMMLTLVMGATGTLVSVVTRMPISIAWSTPGSALLIATPMLAGGYPSAVGAFILASLLIILAGLWPKFGKAVSAIPMPLASAMLAGVLLDLCLQPVKAVATMPALALPIVIAWCITLRFARLWATPVALAVTVVVVVLTTTVPPGAFDHVSVIPLLQTPRFDTGAMLSVGVPLFVVTMASQNVPGLAVLAAHGYRAPVSRLFVLTGLASLINNAFGAHQINLAAITAALCASPEAHPDPARRWWSAATAGAVYVVFGLGTGFAVALIRAMPPLLITLVAGLALFGSLAGALAGALHREEDRIPAILTFAVAGSGVTGAGLKFFGIGPAFWGLLAGGAMMALMRWRR